MLAAYQPHRDEIIISIILSLVFVLLLPISQWVIVLLLLFILLPLTNERLLVNLTIVLFLLLVSDVGETIRVISNLTAFLYLTFVFVKQYGTKFITYPRFPDSVTILILLVLVSMILSSLASVNLSISLVETFRQIIFFLLSYLYFALLKSGEKLGYLFAIIYSGSLLGLFIILIFFISGTDLTQFITMGFVKEGGYFHNASGPGGILAVAIPLTLSYLFYIHKKDKKLYNLMLGLFFVQILGLIITNSRGAILSVIISIIVISFMLKRRMFKRVVMSAIGAVVLIFMFLPSIFDLLGLYFRVAGILENSRLLFWQMSIDIIRNNPIFGTGPGVFKSFMYNHLPVMLGTWDATQIGWIYDLSALGESHNFILFKGSELGILGLLTAILLPSIFLIITIRTLNNFKTDKKIYFMIIGILGMSIGMFFRSFIEATGFLSNGWISRDLPFWLSFITIMKLSTKDTSEKLN